MQHVNDNSSNSSPDVEPDTTVAGAPSDAVIVQKKRNVKPLIALRDTVIFPQMSVPLQIGRARSVAALSAALAKDGMVVLVAQRDPDLEAPTTIAQVHSVGVLGRIVEANHLPDGTARAIVRGERRVHLLDLIELAEGVPAVVIEPLADKVADRLELDALVDVLRQEFTTYCETANIAPDALSAIAKVDDPSTFIDMLVYTPEMTTELRQQLLAELDVAARARLAINFFIAQRERAQLRERIASEVRTGIDKTQREFMLREQQRAIARELGEEDPVQAESSELRAQIESMAMPDEVKTRALKEVERMSRIPSASPEVALVRNYLDWIISLPWGTSSPDSLNLADAERILDEDHYGLEKVKERILEYLAVRTLADGIKSPILLFVGPPGVGKTSLGKSVARAMGRKFVRMSLGGLHDEAEIRGHRRTYIGALPGRIIQGIKNAATDNPVFMLDEIDKVGADFRGDPSSALLEVLDPEQNNTFRDNYLELPFDLSKVLFIATANVLHTIPPALRDRMEVISIAGYTQNEKLHIARRYLVPKQLTNHGLTEAQLVFPDDALNVLIAAYTREAGVRNLEREIAGVARKVARRVASDRSYALTLDLAHIVEFLGPERFESGQLEPEDQVGIATGLVVSDSGGDIIQIEATKMQGKDSLLLTGQLGDVMQESARAALSYVRSQAQHLGIAPDAFDNQVIHLHVPAGAIPKDGPSAGITMATVLASLFTDRPVRRDLAMTGEITLRGRVLPIGGLKSKLLAAHAAGVKTVIIPARNAKDLADVPAEILAQMEIIPADEADQVLAKALLAEPRPVVAVPFSSDQAAAAA